MPSQNQLACLAGLSINYFMARIYSSKPYLNYCAANDSDCARGYAAVHFAVFLGFVQAVHNIFYDNDFINSINGHSIIGNFFCGVILHPFSVLAQGFKFFCVSTAMTLVASDASTVSAAACIISLLTSTPFMELCKSLNSCPTRLASYIQSP